MNTRQAEMLRDLAAAIIKITGKPATVTDFTEYDDQIKLTLKIKLKA